MLNHIKMWSINSKKLTFFLLCSPLLLFLLVEVDNRSYTAPKMAAASLTASSFIQSHKFLTTHQQNNQSIFNFKNHSRIFRIAKRSIIHAQAAKLPAAVSLLGFTTTAKLWNSNKRAKLGGRKQAGTESIHFH